MEISQGRLLRQESTLSFHRATEVTKDNLQKVLGNPILVAVLYAGSQLFHNLLITIISSSFLSKTSNVESLVISVCLLRVIFIVFMLLGYMKIFQPNLMSIDQSNARLIFVSAGIFFFVSLSHYYSFVILPISQAATLNHLIPPITLALSHFFIAPLDQKSLIVCALPILATITFESSFFQYLLILISPFMLSLAATLKKITTKDLHPMTIMLYSSVLLIPTFLIVGLITGTLSILGSFYLQSTVFMISLFQVLQFALLNELLTQQTQPLQIWILQVIVVGACFIFQIYSQIGVIAVFGQVIIIAISLLIAKNSN